MAVVAGGFSKIEQFISDVQVSRIDCFGADKPIGVVLAGRKIKTKIALTSDEIQNVFETISSMANVPLMDGVVKVNVGKINFEGMNTITPKFTIKKQTAYSMLEAKPRPRGRLEGRVIRR